MANREPRRNGASARRKQQPVLGPEPRSADLAAKDRKLGMEHEDLKVVLRLVAATEEHAELKRVTDNEV